MSELDAFVGAVDRLSRLAELAARQREWAETDSKRCGNCTRWMKSRECPREKSSTTGYSRGPDCNAPACQSFELEPRVAKLKAERGAKINDEMVALGL